MKLSVKVHAKSRQAKVVRRDDTHYEVWVHEAPDKGRANEAVVDALSDFLGAPKSRLCIVSGLASSRKVIERT